MNLTVNGDRTPVWEYSAAELAALLDKGDLSSEDLVEMFLERISLIDDNGPALNAVIEVNPDALEIARRLDRERAAGDLRGPLHGIPVLLKDNIDTGDKMVTSAGSMALASNHAPEDAFIVRQLRQAGMIILGKTNLSEWANFRSERSVSGWSGRGGQTLNPYVLDRNPCGSSSGSAVAVSAGLAPFAVGTETNGSIVCPSSANGVVGLKPTLGLVSRSGIIPIAHSQDTAGPMAKTVEDAVLLLMAMRGNDPEDPVTEASAENGNADFRSFLNKDGLKGLRVGVGREFFGFHSEVDALMEQALKDMEKLGAVLVDPVEFGNLNAYHAEAYEVLLYEFKSDIDKYLAVNSKVTGIYALEDLIRFNSDNASVEMPWFGQEIFELAAEKGGLDTPGYLESLDRVRTLSGREGIDAVLEKYAVDVIVAPTGSPAWTIDQVNGDHFLGASSSPAARAGYPNISVPMGYVHGLPAGISFFSGAWHEGRIISAAYAYEQGTRHRRFPEFLETVQF